jgi:hypothetical protein
MAIAVISAAAICRLYGVPAGMMAGVDLGGHEDYSSPEQRSTDLLTCPPPGAGRRGGRRRDPAAGGCLGVGQKGLSADITPLVAVSLARWGHATRAHLHNREPSIYI